METLVLVIHMLAALAIIGLIMLQQGKGAEMGASFGAGASQTLFGSRGSGNFLSRSTALIAAIFFVTSFGLAVIAKQKATVDENMGFSVPVNEVPVSTEDQTVNETPATNEPADSAVTEVPTVAPDENAVTDVPTVQDSEEPAQQPVTDVPQAEDAPAESN